MARRCLVITALIAIPLCRLTDFHAVHLLLPRLNHLNAQLACRTEMGLNSLRFLGVLESLACRNCRNVGSCRRLSTAEQCYANLASSMFSDE